MEAQEYYTRAVEAQPDFVPALKRLAWLHTQRRFDTNEYGAFDDALLAKRDEDAEDCYRCAFCSCSWVCTWLLCDLFTHIYIRMCIHVCACACICI